METISANISDIERKVKSIIAWKLGVSEKEVTSQANFSNNLFADELDMVDIIMEFEKEFHISIPDDQIEKISTVSEAVARVKENGKQKVTHNPAYSLLIGPPLYREYEENNPGK